jgi:hypothetical protein
VVDNDDLPDEFFCNGWWIVNWTRDVSAVDIGFCDAANVHSDVVAWFCEWDLCVVHFNGFYFSGFIGWHEYEVLTWF